MSKNNTTIETNPPNIEIETNNNLETITEQPKLIPVKASGEGMIEVRNETFDDLVNVSYVALCEFTMHYEGKSYQFRQGEIIDKRKVADYGEILIAIQNGWCIEK